RCGQPVVFGDRIATRVARSRPAHLPGARGSAHLGRLHVRGGRRSAGRDHRRRRLRRRAFTHGTHGLHREGVAGAVGQAGDLAGQRTGGPGARLGGVANRGHDVRGDGRRTGRAGVPAHRGLTVAANGRHAGGRRRRGPGDDGDRQVVRGRGATDGGGDRIGGRRGRRGGLAGNDTRRGVEAQARRQGRRNAPAGRRAAGHRRVGLNVLVHHVRGVLGDVGQGRGRGRDDRAQRDGGRAALLGFIFQL